MYTDEERDTRAKEILRPVWEKLIELVTTDKAPKDNWPPGYRAVEFALYALAEHAQSPDGGRGAFMEVLAHVAGSICAQSHDPATAGMFFVTKFGEAQAEVLIGLGRVMSPEEEEPHSVQ